MHLLARYDGANGDDDNRGIEHEALSCPAMPACFLLLSDVDVDGWIPATRTVLLTCCVCAAAACARMRFFISEQSRATGMHARHGMTLLASYYALVTRPARSCLLLRCE